MIFPKLTGKWLIIVAIALTTAIVAPSTAFITSKVKNAEFAATKKVYEKEIDRLFGVVTEALKIPKNMISNTWNFKKNKNGEMVFIPTSNMNVQESVKDLNSQIDQIASGMNIASSDTIKPRGFWDKFKDWFYKH